MGTRLVRHRALENWSVPGAEHQVRPVVDKVEHLQLLGKKGIEEATELAYASGYDEVLGELTDVYHVLEAYERLYDIDPAEIGRMKLRKGKASGYFNPGMVWDTGR
jgi:predicted house-cleaning noncanonical NTP pyrophosphatase (MazG superfamily)